MAYVPSSPSGYFQHLRAAFSPSLREGESGAKPVPPVKTP